MTFAKMIKDALYFLGKSTLFSYSSVHDDIPVSFIMNSIPYLEPYRIGSTMSHIVYVYMNTVISYSIRQLLYAWYYYQLSQ